MRKFSDIVSRDSLADFLGIQSKYLSYVLYIRKVESYYTTFNIPKKSGGQRQICAPTGLLKTIQKNLARVLWGYQMIVRQQRKIHSNVSHAFEKKKSIMSNAQIHHNKYLVLNVDLEHFFESFHFGRVVGYFEKNRDFSLPHEVAVILAQLCCYHGHLPQGAPTSPIITNLICQILDMRILKLAKKYRLDYTRYADDMTFSTNDRSFVERKNEFMSELEAEIKRAGFSVNHKKTRMTLKDSKQVVTGLVVNQKVNVDSAYYRQTRAMAYHLYTKGYFEIDGVQGSLNQLEGRFSFIDQLDHYNNKRDGERHDFRKLNGREKQYQAFLFYRYFLANEKPLIVTEGKTDIRYLKAALKSLWKEYPELVERQEDGSLKYKVTFLRRTKRLRYFMNIHSDGADTMQNIVNFYSTGTDKGYPNYFEFFSKMGTTPVAPVVLLYDNEMNTNKKPLGKLLSHIQLGSRVQEDFKTKLYIGSSRKVRPKGRKRSIEDLNL